MPALGEVLRFRNKIQIINWTELSTSRKNKPLRCPFGMHSGLEALCPLVCPPLLLARSFVRLCSFVRCLYEPSRGRHGRRPRSSGLVQSIHPARPQLGHPFGRQAAEVPPSRQPRVGRPQRYYVRVRGGGGSLRGRGADHALSAEGGAART